MKPSWKQRKVFFVRLTQEFNTILDYNFQEGSDIKLLNIDIIQIKYGINIDQIYHIMKKIIQEYLEKDKLWSKIKAITISSW